jgi:diaminopimelate decarboxylase
MTSTSSANTAPTIIDDMGIDALEVKENTLYIDGCSTVELAKEYGTPLYVMSRNTIAAHCQELRDTWLGVYPNTKACYASKAFLTLAMCKIIEAEGLSLDVVSGGELYTAIKAEFPAERLEIHGNNKSYDELYMAIEYGVGHIIVDAYDELDIIEDICEKLGKTTKVLFRITPGVKVDTHEKIVTGAKGSKFGFPVESDVLYPLFRQAMGSKYIEFRGIHFHVGSQLFTNQSHLDALEVALQILLRVKEDLGFTMPELNLGGGFGINYIKEDNRKSYAYFLDPMMKRVHAFCQENQIDEPQIVIEPGRSIVGDAGIQLYTVGAIKEIKDLKTYVCIDGGMSDNIRPALYDAKYEGIIADKASEPRSDIVTVAGKCCESGDIIMKDVVLQRAERGDILAVLSTGAYGYSMASNYNKLTKPAVVLADNGDSRLIVKRQSYEDLISLEVL